MDIKIAEQIFVGSFGAFLQELLHWYGLRFKLSSEEYDNLLKSVRYWIIISLMVISAGILTYIWFADSSNHRSLREFILFGFSFPLILKKAGEAVALQHTEEKLGEEKSPAIKESTWLVYLGLSSKLD